MAKDTKDAAKGAKDAVKALKGQKAHLVLLLDESGSMGHNQEAVVTGVNEFLHTFREKKDTEVRVWISNFDHHPGSPKVRPIVEGKKISKVEDITVKDYIPRGGTPLNDAILATISQVEQKAKKDERVFMVILTDGHENASEATVETVKKAIDKYEAGDQWTFLYLGANQNAQATAAQYGLGKAGTSMNFAATARGTRSSIAYATQDAVSNLSMPKHEHEKLRSAAFAVNKGTIAEDEDE